MKSHVIDDIFKIFPVANALFYRERCRSSFLSFVLGPFFCRWVAALVPVTGPSAAASRSIQPRATGPLRAHTSSSNVIFVGARSQCRETLVLPLLVSHS